MPVEYLTVNHLSTKELIRLFSKITIHPDLLWDDTPCWIWCAARDPDGYGVTGWYGYQQRVHRLMFAWLVHAIPKGQPANTNGIDHLCRRRACCNPLHLEFTSTRINVLRGSGAAAKNARKTHCKRGHPLSGRNLQVRRGMRQCLICIKQSETERREIINANARRAYHQRKLTARALGHDL